MIEQRQRIEEVIIFDSVGQGENVNLRVIHSNSFPSEEEQSFGLWNDEEYRKRLLERRKQIAEHPVYYDGVNLFFDCLTIDRNGNRVMYMRDTLYSIHKTLEQTLTTRDTGSDLRTRLIRTGNVVAVVETSDGKLVFGYRSGGSEDFGGMYLPPAGFTDYRKDTDPNKGPVSEDFFDRSTDKEIREEIGINTSSLRKQYLGFVGGVETRSVAIVTYVKLNHTSEEVERAFQRLNRKLKRNGRRIEHDHLIYVPFEPWKHFISGRYTGVLNPFVPIAFEDGLFISGPKETIGKPYQQFGEGIGSVLNYTRFRSTDSAEGDLKNRVIDSGLVRRVSYLDPNAKLLYNMDALLRL
ncbi:hypothetical protein HYV88_00295 [Candidatus Woesearchaeota archaeon]|nr:hypothetical protein [Candidatus Woesearchaeota archaeon]